MSTATGAEMLRVYHCWCGATQRPELRADEHVEVAIVQAIFVESDAEPVRVGKCSICKGTKWECMHAVKGDWLKSLRDACENGWLRDPDDPTFDRRACTACNEAGDEFSPVAVQLHKAASGDEPARNVLLVHADYLCSRGNPLGELLNWVLLLWLREPANLSHTGDAVRWLEWLTAQRELMRNRSALTDTYTVTVDGREYGVAVARDSMTASEIAAALNEAVGGDRGVAFSTDGEQVVVNFPDRGAHSVIAELRESPVVQVPQDPRRREHARHIGDRLGRRLGVRR